MKPLWIIKIRHLSDFLMSTGGGSSGQIARGGFWVFATYGLEQTLSIVRSVILARLLTPADFGLMGMALLSLALMTVFTETGIWTALIQRSDLDQPTLNTAWLISAARGVLLGLLSLAVAPWIAQFFDAPLLGPMLRVMSLSFVLSGFNSLGLVLLQRDMDFRILSVFSLVTTVINLFVSVAAAFFLRSVWALILGTLAGSFVALYLSYMVHPFRPQFRFDRKCARELWSFGKFLTASSVVNYTLSQGDDAYVGKTLGAEPLGLYEVAYRISNLPATSISHVLNRVTLPAYSAMKNDLAQLRRAYLRILKLTALITIPMSAGLFGLAPLIVGVLYGEKWMPMVPAFQILCLFGLERSIGSAGSPVFLALGKPKIALRVSLVKLVVMALVIVPSTVRWGITGTSLAVTLSAMAVQLTVVPIIARMLQMHWTEILGPMIKPFLAALGMLGGILGVQYLIRWFSGPWSLALLICLGAVLYGILMALLDRKMVRSLRARWTEWSIAKNVSG